MRREHSKVVAFKDSDGNGADHVLGLHPVRIPRPHIIDLHSHSAAAAVAVVDVPDLVPQLNCASGKVSGEESGDAVETAR